MQRDEPDFILRMIAAAAAVVARLRTKLGGGGSAEEVLAEARAAQGELLGKDFSLLIALDPTTAAQMLGARAGTWADLLDVEADALRAAGRKDEAYSAAARASGLRSARKP